MRNRLKVRAEMHGALEPKDLGRLGFGADMAKLFLIRRLHASGGDDDAHAVEAQQRCRAEIGSIAAVKRPGAEKTPVRQIFDLEQRCEGWIALEGLAADADIGLRTLPRLVSEQRRLGIVDHAEHGIGTTRFDHGAEKPRRVARAACPGIVLGIGDDHRPFRPGRHGAGDRDFWRQQLVLELGLAGDDMREQLIRRSIGRFLIFAIGDDRRTAFGDIGLRKARRERDRGDATLFQIGNRPVNPEARFDQRALRRQRQQERHFAKGLAMRLARTEQPVEIPRRTRARLRHVDMGIGPIGDQGRSMAMHRLGRIRMKIERNDDRNLRPDGGPEPRQQLPFPVLAVLGDHGTVQIEVDRLEFTRCFDRRDDLVRDAFECIFRDIAARHCRAPQKRHDLMPKTLGLRHEARDRDIHAVEDFETGIAPRQRGPALAPHEIFVSGEDRCESVGLVLKPGNQNARHVVLSCRVDWSGRSGTCLRC